MGYISEEDFERLIQSSARKTNRNPDDIRASVRKFLTEEHGVVIGLPLEEQIRQAQVRAGEDAVIANLGRDTSTASFLEQIKRAQVEAGENIVLQNLQEKGLQGPDLRTVK